MIRLDQKAEEVYAIGEQSLKRGVARELLPDVKEFSGGYSAMVSFLLRRGAMLVGDMADPYKVVGHLEDEQREAVADAHDREKHIFELGDTLFIVLVIEGLLWGYLEPEKRKLTREILVWSKVTAHDERIDLNKAVVRVATVKNVENYPVDALQLRDGETVGEVVARLPGIYTMLRERRQNSSTGVLGYSHLKASSSDGLAVGERYDA